MSLTTISILSPEAANGRNVVAYGVIRALASEKKTACSVGGLQEGHLHRCAAFRGNAGIAREQAVGVCPRRAREDKEGSRADIVAAYQETLAAAAPEAMVGRRHRSLCGQRSRSVRVQRRCRRDLASPVFLARMRHRPHPEQVKDTVAACTAVVRKACTEVLGVFVTGCPDENADEVKSALAGDVPVWTIPAVDFSDARARRRRRCRVRRPRTRRRGHCRRWTPRIPPRLRRTPSSTACWAKPSR